MWNSVEDFLPETENLYLCILECEEIQDRLYQLCLYYADEKRFHHRIIPYEVTHWMCIPKMPARIESKPLC